MKNSSKTSTPISKTAQCPSRLRLRTSQLKSEPEKEWREIDYFTLPHFAASPWVTSPGVQGNDREIAQTLDFFSYTSKNSANSYGSAVVNMVVVAESQKMTCELEVVAVYGGMLFGVAAEDVPLGASWMDDQVCRDKVWYYASPDGRFFNGPRQISGDATPCEAAVIRRGHILKIELDAGTASLFVNSKLLGKVAFSAASVRPAVFLFAKGSAVRLASLKVNGMFDPLSAKGEREGGLASTSALWSRVHPALKVSDCEHALDGDEAGLLPASSALVRSGAPPGPCSAVIRYSVSTWWTDPTCCGKSLSVDFRIKRRQGSVDIGMVSPDVPLEGSWCDPACRRR